MSNTISYKLKKRTFADTVISCIICVAALAASVWQFVCFLNGEGKPFITNAVYNFIIFAELGLLSLILLEIRKTGKPFSKKIITKLRIMAVILFIGGLMPSYTEIGVDAQTEMVTFTFDAKNMLIIFIGVIIGIISEVFVYGLSLQEDNDLIA